MEAFRGQSYKWPSFVVNFDGVEDGNMTNVKLLKRQSGNLTEYTVQPGGQWAAVRINFSGKIAVSKNSKADVVLAIASSGSWSGGGNYSGFVFGKPGGAVWFGRKGNQKWLLFTESGPVWHTVCPFVQPTEI